ncbi:MAG: hypothetical protein ACP5QO_08570 [Clostridia bacterium]
MRIIRHVLVLVGTLVVVVGGALFYVRSNPLSIVPAAVHAAGSQVLDRLLHQHPIVLWHGTETAAVPVSVAHQISDRPLAKAVGSTVADIVPTHFAVTQADLASVPVAARPLTTKLAGMQGTVTGLAVTALSGTTQQGHATLTANITLNGHPYQVTGVVSIAHGAITAISDLSMQEP